MKLNRGRLHVDELALALDVEQAGCRSHRDEREQSCNLHGSSIRAVPLGSPEDGNAVIQK